MPKIVVRTPNWLGDAVLSLPFFDDLHRCFPQSGVDIIAKDSIQAVFQYHPAVRAIHPFSKACVNGWAGLFRYGRALRTTAGPYDFFITLPTSFSAALIGYGVGSRVRAGFQAIGRNLLLTHRFPQPRGLHRVQTYRQLLKDLQMPMPPADAPVKITFHFSAEERRTVFLPKQNQCKYVVFNVNAEAPSRRLPLEKWVALGNQLLQYEQARINLVFIGTTPERPRVAEVWQTLEPKTRLLDFAGKTSVRELALLLRDADAVVSNDSGPMHLANAVGAPLVTFFGAGDSRVTGPFNPGKTIVLNQRVPCSPCVKNTCRFPTVRCLESIPVAEIYQSVLNLLNA